MGLFGARALNKVEALRNNSPRFFVALENDKGCVAIATVIR
jgi:hypothetical protein